MKITFDLDSVIFNLKPLEMEAFKRAGRPYIKATSWNLCYIDDENVCNNLRELWADDMLYSMPLIDKGIPHILNSLLQRPDLDIAFVTERRLKQPEKTFKQLTNAGIKCSFEQVYDQDGLKSDILKDLGTDMHFDDSPWVVSGCLEKKVPIVMISNNSTLYNHYLRDQVEHYKSLRQALIKKGIYKPTKIR